jgi:hypothetical protein
MQTMTPDRGGVVTNGFSSKIATKLRKSAYVLRREGAPRLLELSALSLIEPIRVLRLRAAVSFDATRALSKLIPILHQSELMMYGKDVMERTSPGLRSM